MSREWEQRLRILQVNLNPNNPEAYCLRADSLINSGELQWVHPLTTAEWMGFTSDRFVRAIQ